MIKELENGGFVASAYRVWIPGVFASRKAARFAFRLTPCQQSELANEVSDRLISWDDIKKKISAKTAEVGE